METLQPDLTMSEAFAVLSNRGYRSTAPRRAVVETVLIQSRPFTTEQIVVLLPDISRATIYRTIELMATADLITRLLQSNGHPAYVVGKPGHRHHLVCSDCGLVIPFTACPIEPVVSELVRDTEFAIQGHHLDIFGLCPACQP